MKRWKPLHNPPQDDHEAGDMEERPVDGKRAVVNMIGNGVATLVVARWERELDREPLKRNLV
jgi:hypothetical protein